MKSLFISLVLLSSCSLNKEIVSLYELQQWSIKSDTIYKNAIPIAVYDHYEYELNPSHGKQAKPIIELSVKKLSANQDELDNLIRFIHVKHKKQKVEIVVSKN